MSSRGLTSGVWWWGRVLSERLLPALLSAVASSEADADMRFSCLKVMSDLLALLLDIGADGDAPPHVLSASTCRLVAVDVAPVSSTNPTLPPSPTRWPF